jgi:predicted DNA-binding WGR domain protein
MLNLLSIYLEAVNPQAHHFRAYSISCGKDLLGEWLVQTTFGKIGKRGTTKSYAFPEQEKAQKHINTLLKKRFTAHKRIGCNYEIKSCKIDPNASFIFPKTVNEVEIFPISMV